MAASSLGKLDAICAKLKSSQQTAIGCDVKNGSIGLDLCKGNMKDDEAVWRPTGPEKGSGGRDSDKHGVRLNVEVADVNVSAKSTPDSDPKCRRNHDESEAAVTENKGNKGFTSSSNPSNGENCAPACDAFLSTNNNNNSNNNNINNNNSKTRDYNDKTELESELTESLLSRGEDVSKSFNHSNEVPPSPISPSSLPPPPSPPPPSSSSIDQVTSVPSEDEPHGKKLVESSLSREVLSTPIPSLSATQTSTPANAQPLSTTSFISSLSLSSASQSSPSMSSSSLSSQSLLSTPNIQINSVDNENEMKSEFDCGAVPPACCEKDMDKVSSAYCVRNHSQSGLSTSVSTNQSLFENDGPIDTNRNNDDGNKTVSHNPECKAIPYSKVKDCSDREPSSSYVPHGISDVKIISSINDNNERKWTERKDDKKNGNSVQIHSVKDGHFEHLNREDIKQNDTCGSDKICSDQKPPGTYEPIAGTQESSSHVKTTFDLSPAKSEKNADRNTVDPSAVQAVTFTTEEKPALSQTPTSGRKNRRKAAKPQKQVGGRYYTSHNFIEQTSVSEEDMMSDVPMETDESFVTEDTTEGYLDGFPRGSTARAHQAPLDLSSGQFMSLSDETQNKAPMGEVPSSSSAQENCNEDDPISSSIEGGASVDGQQGGDDEEAGMAGSTCRQKERQSSGGESSDSNVMLADYAKHTMTELLGIYGFEGADAKNVNLGRVDPSLFPRANETSPSTATQAPTAKINRGKKSGPFVKKVYTSLMTPSSTGEVTKHGFHLQVPSLPLTVGAGFSSTTAVSNSQSKDSKINSGKLLGNRISSVTRKNYTTKALNSADFHNYIRRYGSGTDCGGEHCKDLGYRDHYHCLDCPHKVFIRKEEMVRHFKWHKKRQESLQHGFMRYSPMDDCSKRFGSCAHNGRQTHYHCVQRGCDKVYISTSDVQMHANFHRKDSAIIQEGFQRFRATEDCGTTSCTFYGQRTTHFHCRRPQCNFTFKNKSDMEKHKSYHQKDQVLSKDGFKKFMKYESCPYVGCRYSKSSNHIHCIRPGCQYVLHSTAQLYSHKRKHDRREFENAYRSYRQLQQQTPAQMRGKDAKSLLNHQNQGRPATTGSVTFIPLPATNTSVTSHSIPTGQLPSGMLALQGVQLNNKILTSFKADAFSSKESSLVPKREADLASAMNLTHQSNIYQLAKVGETDEERQTMALPVPLMLPAIKNEVDDESGTNGESCEAEDLSLNKKRKSGAMEDNDTAENQSKVFIKDEADPSSDDNRNPEESVSGVEEDEEEEYDDDEDEDDDDRDYGQVEEPTLVNNLESSGEGDRLNSGSADLTISAVKKESPESSVITSHVKMEPGTSDIKQEGSTGIAEALAHPPSSVTPPKSHLTTLPMSGKIVIDKKERDESWKKYLIRYTANDACYSRCACLYKDHYHCRVEGCQVIFKSKDGVRSHARFHENQDSITPLVYSKFDALTPCKYQGCPYTEKELHYHCNWTNCKQVIPHSGPTFALLEHYRIHELGINALNRGTKNITTPMPGIKELDPLQKRRGRPPKYPRDDLPVVPKVHLTEKEIMDSTLAFIHKKFNEDSHIINGFKKILASETCPDENCMFQSKDHFHCGRKFCHMSTDRLDFLTLHSKDFHNNVTILEGYEFFERNVNCRRPHCHNNRVNRHYHCMRPRCDYSFVRHSTMVQHNKKHPTAPSAVLTHPGGSLPVSHSQSLTNKINGQQFVAIAPALLPSQCSSTIISPRSTASSSNIITSPSTATRNKLATAGIADNNISNTGNITLAGKTVVKSNGTYFPLSGLSNIQLSGIPVQTATTTAIQGQNVVSTSLSGTTACTASGSVPGAGVPMVPSSLITPVTSTQVIQGAQILQAQNGASVVNTGGMCLTLPPNLASSSIPILTQQAQNQQPALLTGIIPMGNLATSQSIAPQLVNIPGAQIIATSQGSFLQHGSVLGSNLVQVIQNPITVISSGTAPATSISATPGSTLAVTGSVSGTAAPLTFLLQQQQQQQQQHQQQAGDGSVVPLRWANLKKKMHYPLSINCGRPFCKLKKKDHYHCLDCYQAFSDPARLRVHLSKHGFKFKKADSMSKGQDSQQDQIVTKVSQGLDLSFHVKKQVRDKSLADQSCSIPGSSTALAKKEVESQGLSSSLNLCPSVFTEMVKKGKEAEETSSESATSKLAEKITLVMSNINSQWTISKGDGKRNLETSSKEDSNAVKKYVNGNNSITEDEVSVVAIEQGESLADNDYDSDTPVLMVDEGRDESNDSSLNASSSSLTLCSSLSRKSRQRRPSVRSKDYVDSETIVEARPSKPRKKYKKDFDLPEGFTYVKCSQDCGYTRCAYRQSVTHFHCLRSDCGYGISDRSRIIQHRMRHERLDALMGGEFQHFRASVSCDRADCEFDEKSSHFHCLRCPYSCADSGRVPAHRKYHAKLDNVSNNGFIKFTGVQDCQTASCYYFRKQTHYHCTFPGCNHSVLGPSQMAPHKLKHAQHSQ